MISTFELLHGITMNNTTYPSSETENNKTPEGCDFFSTVSNDAVDQWMNMTVEKEVLRGTKIREEKLKPYPVCEEECELVNIDLVKTSCFAETSYFSNGLPGSNKHTINVCSASPRSNLLYKRQNLTSRVNIPNLKEKSVRRCPMRIVELAVPSKRQCIDTWRNKCDVLPAFMVERLRQQVLDEKPIVQIRDAIGCFAKRKPKPVNKRSKKVTRETKQDDKRIFEIRNLSEAFAKKIAQNLIKPRNFNLSPELDKLSKVVANEITKIIGDRKKFNVDNDANNRIRADISAKIAVWMANILEDSSYKLLEDDLRELEEQEGPVLDLIDDLIQNVVTISDPELIHVVERQKQVYISKNTSEASQKDMNSSFLSLDIKGDKTDTATLFRNITYDNKINKSIKAKPFASENSNDGSDLEEKIKDSFDYINNIKSVELYVTDHIKGALDRIIDTIDVSTNDSENQNNEHEKVEINKNEEVNVDALMLPNNELERIIDVTRELANKISQVQSIPELPLIKDTDIYYNNEKEVVVIKSDELIQSENAKVSDSFESFAEESLDENNKKVKFSEIDIGYRGSTGKLNSGSVKQVKGNKILEKQKLYWSSSTDSFRKEIQLARPNETLLTDADESWPMDIATPPLKPSASVSRSITSLGRILENDEKLLLSDDEIRSKLSWDGTQQREEKIIIKKELNKPTFPDNDLGDIKGLNEELQNTKDEKEALFMVALGNKKFDSEELKSSIHTVEVQEMDIDKEGSDREAVQVTSELEDPQKTGSSLLVQLDSKIHDYRYQLSVPNSQGETNIAEDLESGPAVIPAAEMNETAFFISDQKFDFKVYPKTAPKWLRRDRGKGEPSEGLIRDGYKAKVKFHESDMRRWCKDLDRMFANLEMWNSWVDTSCKQIINLKHKREINSLFAPSATQRHAREWAKLKKDIVKDSILWAKLNKRAYEKLKIYKDTAKIGPDNHIMCACNNNIQSAKSNL